MPSCILQTAGIRKQRLRISDQIFVIRFTSESSKDIVTKQKTGVTLPTFHLYLQPVVTRMAATVVTGSDSDLLSEQLIARLLETDLLILESAKQAERLQLDQVIAVSARAQGRIPRYTKGVMEETRDSDLAFEMYVSEARVSGDAAYARAVQSQGHVADTIDRQYAQKLAAGERCLLSSLNCRGRG